MTKYLKSKDGKFAGSIGDGKTNAPTAADPIPTGCEFNSPDANARQTLADLYLEFRDLAGLDAIPVSAQPASEPHPVAAASSLPEGELPAAGENPLANVRALREAGGRLISLWMDDRMYNLGYLVPKWMDLEMEAAREGRPAESEMWEELVELAHQVESDEIHLNGSLDDDWDVDEDGEGEYEPVNIEESLDRIESRYRARVLAQWANAGHDEDAAQTAWFLLDQ